MAKMTAPETEIDTKTATDNTEPAMVTPCGVDSNLLIFGGEK